MNPEPLTRRQSQVFAFVRDYIEEHHLSPTLEEIGEALGVNRVTVFEHVKALEEKGWIQTRRHHSRSIEIIDPASPGTVPILGRIAAGAPIDAVEDRQTFEISSFFPTDRDCFMLEVQGDSMIEDHIRDGDLVLIESRSHARRGETVVALIEVDGAHETTLKVFYPEGPQIRLEPRNAALDPILVDARQVTIQGVVIGVLRRYA